MAAPTKEAWRRRAATARQHVEIDHAAHRDALARFLVGLSSPGWVVAYHALPGEVDLGPLLTKPHLARFAVTRTPEQGIDLTVHPHGGPLERHRFGFDQPLADAPVVADDDIGVVLVPGLAFDRLGTRLGHGAGYYDRFLARLGPDTIRIGVTGGYFVAELPAEPHDVSMTHLAGEFGVLPVPLDEPEG